MGLLVSGGSMASLTCLAAARHRAAAADGWDVRRARDCGTSPRRSCSTSRRRATAACGRPPSSSGSAGTAVRTIPVDGDFRMDVRALRAAVAADRAAGRRPFCVAASAGTVNTGAIDPLDDVADALPGRGPLVPRRRRLRRHRRRGPDARPPLRRPRARGLARARSPQVALGAGGVRLRARPGRAAAPGHVEPRAARTSGPRRARASAASPGTRSTGSSRPAASGRSSSG